MWEGDYVFLDLLRREEPFFSLKLVYVNDRLTDAILNGNQISTPGIPLMEFDPSPDAVINPDHEKLDIQLPEKCVFAFKILQKIFGFAVFRLNIVRGAEV